MTSGKQKFIEREEHNKKFQEQEQLLASNWTLSSKKNANGFIEFTKDATIRTTGDGNSTVKRFTSGSSDQIVEIPNVPKVKFEKFHHPIMKDTMKDSNGLLYTAEFHGLSDDDSEKLQFALDHTYPGLKILETMLFKAADGSNKYLVQWEGVNSKNQKKSGIYKGYKGGFLSF